MNCELAARMGGTRRFDDRRPSECLVVAGPRGAGKTRWIQACIDSAPVGQSCAVLLVEEGRTRMENIVGARPAVAVRKLALPCSCCPAAAGLPEAALHLAETAGWPTRLFIELPIDAAAGLLDEFDNELGWSRKVTVCLNSAWANAWRRQALSPFQSIFLARADDVIETPTPSVIGARANAFSYDSS